MNFKELLRKHGFTCASFAKQMGISRVSPYYWAEGKVMPRYETLKQASELLGETIETIVAAIEKKEVKT